VNPLRKITDGVTDENIYKRISWMYLSFFLLYASVTMLSHYLLPEGILRGKHPIISALEFSPNLWISMLQIFGYNLIATLLIIGANLLAQEYRLSKGKFVPIGYTVFWALTVLFAAVVGTWSFETAAPPLHYKVVRIFDVFHHAGLLEFSAYLLAAVASFKFTLWYSDGKRIIASRKWKGIKLARSEKACLMLAFVLLFCAAYVESPGIIQLTG